MPSSCLTTSSPSCENGSRPATDAGAVECAAPTARPIWVMRSPKRASAGRSTLWSGQATSGPAPVTLTEFTFQVSLQKLTNETGHLREDPQGAGELTFDASHCEQSGRH